jgi:hypothetical protein
MDVGRVTLGTEMVLHNSKNLVWAAVVVREVPEVMVWIWSA